MANKKRHKAEALAWFLGAFWVIYFALLAPWMISSRSNELVLGCIALGLIMMRITWSVSLSLFTTPKEGK